MVLEERKCPNCGSGDVLEKDGTFVCMNCRTFFDNPQHIKITKVTRDETKIEKALAKEREEKNKLKMLMILLPTLFGIAILVWLIQSIFGLE